MWIHKNIYQADKRGGSLWQVFMASRSFLCTSSKPLVHDIPHRESNMIKEQIMFNFLISKIFTLNKSEILTASDYFLPDILSPS